MVGWKFSLTIKWQQHFWIFFLWNSGCFFPQQLSLALSQWRGNYFQKSFNACFIELYDVSVIFLLFVHVEFLESLKVLAWTASNVCLRSCIFRKHVFFFHLTSLSEECSSKVRPACQPDNCSITSNAFLAKVVKNTGFTFSSSEPACEGFNFSLFCRELLQQIIEK